MMPSRLSVPNRLSDTNSPRRRVRRSVAGFLLVLGLLVTGTEVLLSTRWILERLVGPELDFFALVLGSLLEFLGEEVQVVGQYVYTGRFNLKMVQGCDALRPVLLFLCAVLASPVRWWTKLPGAVVGATILVVANFIRLVVLFYVGVHCSSNTFNFMHENVSQVGFILLVIVLWVAWALWAVRRTRRDSAALEAAT